MVFTGMITRQKKTNCVIYISNDKVVSNYFTHAWTEESDGPKSQVLGFVEVRWVPLLSAELQIQPTGKLLLLAASISTLNTITVIVSDFRCFVESFCFCILTYNFISFSLFDPSFCLCHKRLSVSMNVVFLYNLPIWKVNDWRKLLACARNRNRRKFKRFWGSSKLIRQTPVSYNVSYRRTFVHGWFMGPGDWRPQEATEVNAT